MVKRLFLLEQTLSVLPLYTESVSETYRKIKKKARKTLLMTPPNGLSLIWKAKAE
jgi:hypothetical protein